MNFAITFPDRTQATFASMQGWIAAAAVFVIILILFALFVINLSRQKNLAQLKNDFISNMTHELQTPIANISMAAEVLRRNKIADEDKRMKYLAIIEQENRRLRTNVEEVLQAASLERGELVLLKERINVNDLVDNVVANFEVRVRQRNGSIEKSIASENPWVEGDPVHLTNVLHNLLDNADKYSPEPPRIRVSTHDRNGRVTISVEDQGIGISNDIKPSIFEKFFRGGRGNVHDVKGFGLGLSYVDMVVKAHQGLVSVRSRIAKGSRFDVILPVR